MVEVTANQIRADAKEHGEIRARIENIEKQVDKLCLEHKDIWAAMDKLKQMIIGLLVSILVAILSQIVIAQIQVDKIQHEQSQLTTLIMENLKK